ncbi:MAG: hypothetical protein ABFR50_01000 [Candidatus Fermentibacteria bacterium]
MKSWVTSIIMLVTIALYSACGDSATEITGTLPVVTGITVDSAASKGDTIVVTWTALTGTEIEGYLFWSRIRQGNPWMLLDVIYQNTAIHIADRSACYTVMAFNGDDTSSDPGMSDNTRTDELSEIRHHFSGTSVGFRIDIEGDSLIPGDPSSPDFQQQFTVAAETPDGNRYIYSGTANPRLWPGGAETSVSLSAGFVAPSPDDSTLWQDSVYYGGNFFLALDSGYYCKLSTSNTVPDTLAFADTLIIEGEIQPIRHVRVFDQSW